MDQNELDLHDNFTQQQYSINRTNFADIPQAIAEVLSPLIDTVGVTTAAFDKETGKLNLEKKQNGIFRVNCRDCCDRTTLGQWSIAREAMWRGMAKLGFNEDARLKVEKALGVLWADVSFTSPISLPL